MVSLCFTYSPCGAMHLLIFSVKALTMDLSCGGNVNVQIMPSMFVVAHVLTPDCRALMRKNGNKLYGSMCLCEKYPYVCTHDVSIDCGLKCSTYNLTSTVHMRVMHIELIIALPIDGGMMNMYEILLDMVVVIDWCGWTHPVDMLPKLTVSVVSEFMCKDILACQRQCELNWALYVKWCGKLECLTWPTFACTQSWHPYYLVQKNVCSYSVIWDAS